MAATESLKPGIILKSPINLDFDLDGALSLPENPSRAIAASNALVSSMPTVAGGAASADRCAVCMERFRPAREGGKQIPCGHVYHSSCIATWLSSYSSCPLCRCEISGPQMNE